MSGLGRSLLNGVCSRNCCFCALKMYFAHTFGLLCKCSNELTTKWRPNLCVCLHLFCSPACPRIAVHMGMFLCHRAQHHLVGWHWMSLLPPDVKWTRNYRSVEFLELALSSLWVFGPVFVFVWMRPQTTLAWQTTATVLIVPTPSIHIWTSSTFTLFQYLSILT